MLKEDCILEIKPNKQLNDTVQAIEKTYFIEKINTILKSCIAK